MRALLPAALLGTAAALLLLAAPAGAEPGLEAPDLLEERGPIAILGDDAFTAENGVRGGSGIPADPYVIAHWRINHTGVHVHVANVSKAFLVRNLDLTGQCPSSGPQSCLEEVGIQVSDASGGGAILHSRLRGFDRIGVFLERSARVEVVQNLVEGGGAASQGAGILVFRSTDAEVRANRLLDVGPAEGSVASAAVRVWDSNDTLVAANEVRGATETGINLLASRRSVVVDNELTGNLIGIAGQGRDGLVHYNTITDNRRYGLLVNANWLRLEHNVVMNNPRGLEVTAPANLTLRDNNIHGNGEYDVRLSTYVSTPGVPVDAKENWWGSPTGPNVNGTGPGTGATIALFQSRASQVGVVPFLTQRVRDAGAFAPRPQATVVTTSTPPPGDPGSSGQAPLAPVAVSEGPGQAFLGSEVQFSAARSFDPQGGSLRYAWDLGDGTQLGGVRARHTYAALGEYVVRLTVTDPDGLSATASVLLRVTREPLGVQLFVEGTGARGEEVLLRAVATGQPTGPVEFRFTTEGPGTFPAEPAPGNQTRVRLAEPREHIVGVEARAGNETATAFERVLAVNRPPVARLAVEPAEGDTRTAFRFSAAGSSDPDGDELTYTWDFGAGLPGAQGRDVTRIFPQPGVRVVLLTVSDGLSTQSAQAVVRVDPASGPDGNGPAPTPGPGLALVAIAIGLAARAARAPPRR